MSTTITHSSGVITPTVQDGYAARIKTRTRVHTILGRRDPDITFRPAGLRAGTLPLVFASRAAAWAAVDVLVVGQVFTFDDSDNPEIGMKFVVPEGELEPRLDDETRSVWLLDVPFQEVSV
ncbi:hypothetical protein [Microbacterium sp. NPDC057658]|uniref:hypothetical protein n=1 Tax=unclassified Microbacterium TaxID=2609290 RepID=UPI00366E2FDA